MGSIRELASADGVDRAYVGRVLDLTLLAPDLVEAVLDGRTVEGIGRLHIRYAMSYCYIHPHPHAHHRPYRCNRKATTELYEREESMVTKSWPGTVFIKFKTKMLGATLDAKLKETPYRSRTEKFIRAKGESKNFGKVAEVMQMDGGTFNIGRTSSTCASGFTICFMSHHLHNIRSGINTHFSDHKFLWNHRSGGIYYDYWEEKDRVKVLSAMQRGKMMSGTGLAQVIERKTRHQHHFYLCCTDLTQDIHHGYGNRAKLVESLGARGCYSGAEISDIIKKWSKENVHTTFAGEISSEGAQEIGPVILEIAKLAAELAVY